MGASGPSGLNNSWTLGHLPGCESPGNAKVRRGAAAAATRLQRTIIRTVPAGWGHGKLDPKELTIAALLHDIGKVMYRGLTEAQKHKVPHQQLGYMWAREKALPEPVQEAIRRHHDVPHSHPRYDELSPHAYGGAIEVRNLLYLVGEADNIAAGMERDEYTEGAFDPSAALANIFSDVQLEGRPQAPRTSWPLRYGEKPSRGVVLKISEREALWRALEADLSRITPNPEPSTLLYFLQKHLSQFPEHSWVGAEPPATSLYSHLKSTAAVALATYRYLEESGVDWTCDPPWPPNSGVYATHTLAGTVLRMNASWNASGDMNHIAPCLRRWL